MNIQKLIVTAESVETGARLIGFVCGCPDCKKPYENMVYDETRPLGMLTNDAGKYGNVKVYTDTMEFYNPLS